MADRILDGINQPADLAGLDHSQLEQLASELRAEMVASTSIHGGHLAPSLGAVELIIALHRVLDCPKDRIIFDVGHQAYAHKLLTGRREQFANLRSLGGLSGFPKIDESPYDSHDSGHASDSLATALGYCIARDIDGRDETVAVLVGDASFVGGMSLEALNDIGQLGTKVIIVLNDNGMSISSSVGGFATYLGKVRMSERYTSLRDQVEESVSSKGKVGRFLMNTGNAVKESVKQLILPGSTFFEGFGVTYIGPVDGHDIANLENIFKDAKEMDGPVLIHAVTTKGKGYEPAERRPDLFHGVGPFDPETGTSTKSSVSPSWTSVFSDELIKMGQEHEDIVAITAAMPTGTGLDAFGRKFPDRLIDTGIAEESAVGIASSLAMSGKVPVVALYSTFMQRAYDQAMINVALQGQHVIFCLDRAGLVGADGPTHHGAFDISFMRTIPGMRIMAPSNDEELRDALRTAYELDGPVCIRYGRGTAPKAQERARELWQVGEGRMLVPGGRVALLAVGDMVNTSVEASAILKEQGIDARVVDMRWAKPVDSKAIASASECDLVVTIENNSVCGGFGTAVLESMAAQGISARVKCLGLPDGFVAQGPVPALMKQLGLDAQSIADACVKALQS